MGLSSLPASFEQVRLDMEALAEKLNGLPGDAQNFFAPELGRLRARLDELARQVTLSQELSPQEEASLQEESSPQEEAATRVYEPAFYALFQHAFDGIILSTPEGRFIAANPAACQMFGKSEEELIQAGRAGTVVQDDCLARALAERKRTGRVRAELTCKRKDGSTFPAEISSVVFTDARNQHLTSVIVRDISDRKAVEASLQRTEAQSRQAKDALRKTETSLQVSEAGARAHLAKYRTLFAAFPLGISISDEDGQIIEANAEAVRLLGVNIKEHTTRKIDGPEWQIIRPDGSPMPPEEYASTRALKEKRRVENVEMGILKPGGTLTWINVCATPIPLEGYGVVITYGDITARRQAEEKLKIAIAEAEASARAADASAKAADEAAKREAAAAVNTAIAAEMAAEERNRLMAVMQALPVGVAILDERGGNVLSNPAFEQIWGGPRPNPSMVSDYAEYKAWWMDTGRPVQPQEWASARAVQQGETVSDQFMRIQGFDGEERYVLNSGAPVFDAQGRLSGSVVAIQDITTRVRAEQELALANSRFETLLENLPIGVILTDAAGNFLIINPANRDLFGGGGVTGDVSGPSGGYTLRYPDGSLIPPEELPLVRALKLGESVPNFEFLIRRESGAEVSILSSTSPVRGADGSIQGAVVAMRDITPIKQVEIQQRLLEFREKERLEIARDLHDGPIQDLIGVLFNVQFAKEAIANPSAQLEFEQVGLGIQGVVRDLREVCNMLRPPSLIRFGLARAIRVQAEDFRERHPEIEMQLDLTDDTGLFSEQTCLALYRIYQEAINNILRHARATRVQVALMMDEHQAVLEIADNGEGFLVSSDLAGQTRSGHFGLAGMKERAEIIDADLQVKSAPGQGTVLRVAMERK